MRHTKLNNKLFNVIKGTQSLGEKKSGRAHSSAMKHSGNEEETPGKEKTRKKLKKDKTGSLKS